VLESYLTGHRLPPLTTPRTRRFVGNPWAKCGQSRGHPAVLGARMAAGNYACRTKPTAPGRVVPGTLEKR
jgi:hypothetical protein